MRREPASAIPQPEACRDARRAEVRPDDPAVARGACCREPGSRSVRETLRVQAWSPAQVHLDGPVARLSEQGVSPSAQASAVLQDPLREAAEAEVASGSGARQGAAWEACAAAEPRREAVAEVWEPGVRRVENAAAGPRPGVAQAASEQQPAEVAAAAEPDGPQVEAAVAAEPDELRAGVAAAQPGAAARQPAEAQRVEVRRGVPVPRAELPLVPSAAASLFGQPLAGPGRQRAAAHFAHAMRSLRIASRSEPSLQAARDEGWS
ncbi:hypothetical protein IQ17_01877 [Bradyrhizobium daqingense]|uniref:Uncharacterized protein n=1 Tax=Bradyrhizobium daqingense TaxID=993502 RepID=A0A562LIW8_9BRAD|nr:hypothetical protein IQ17_01877 [Bradyrhizobium daqingense]